MDSLELSGKDLDTYDGGKKNNFSGFVGAREIPSVEEYQKGICASSAADNFICIAEAPDHGYIYERMVKSGDYQVAKVVVIKKNEVIKGRLMVTKTCFAKNSLAAASYTDGFARLA